jgi:DNA-binding NarL/FixJ family response regulator
MESYIPMKEGNEMLPELTDRENEVLQLIALGFTNREISCHLVISESTVQNHVHHIYEKLGVSNRVQAAAYAIQLRIILQTDILENR